MLNRLYRFRYLLLLLTAVACLCLGPGVRAALVADNSLTVWFLEDDPGLKAYRAFGERFGNDEVVVLVVEDPVSLLTPRHFETFVRLTRALEALPEVEAVIGPGNATLPVREQLGVFARPLLLPGIEPAEVRQRLAEAPGLREQLFSPDYRAARFLVLPNRPPDFDARRGQILARIKATAYGHVSPDRAFFGGVGILYAGLNTLSQQDFGFFLGVGYLIMIGLFVWIYRSLRLLAYTLGIVALATYLTLGAYGALGYRLNLMTVLLPVIIVLLGILDAVHVINEVPRLRDQGMTGKAAALEALRRVWRPCLFTTLTTAAGFLALVTSPMAILRNFGLFAAMGIGLCLYFTCLLGVLMLPGHRPAGRVTQRTAAGLTRLLHLVLARKGLFGGLALLLVVFFGAGIARVRTDTYTLGYLPESHPVVRDHRAIEKAWGLYMPLELLVTPRAGYSLHSPRVVQAARAFADSVRSLPGVGRVFGFYALYEAGLAAQYGSRSPKLLRSKSALLGVHRRLARDYPQLAGKFMHAPSGTGRITVSGAMLSAGALHGKLDTLRGIAAATLGVVARVTPAGYQPLYAGIVGYVTRSQVDSLLVSFGLVFVLVWLFLRDARLAALTVVPNLFPVLVMLGAMGWLGIYLDTATASIAAVVLSICTDDSIHFIHAYRHHRQLGLPPARARHATVAHVGPAVVLAGGVLFGGYAFMLLGSLKTVQLWGLLTAIAIAAAMFGELVLFPLVLERFDREPAERQVPGGPGSPAG